VGILVPGDEGIGQMAELIAAAQAQQKETGCGRSAVTPPFSSLMQDFANGARLPS
jgi:hypothetical protein